MVDIYSLWAIKRRKMNMSKYIITILSVIFLWENSYSQNIENDNNTQIIKITISDVQIAKSKLEEVSYYDAISNLTNGKIEAFPIDSKNQKIVSTRIHPFVGALHYSFAHHRPITISPDMIWLLIMQGFSKHIYYHSDSLKSEIVNFEGKEQISVRRDDFIRNKYSNPWNEVIPEISSQIKTKVNTSLHPLIFNKFSTTTESTSIAHQITLMDALSDYYDFSVQTACGIPYVNLQGTPDDWKWIIDQLPILKEYGMEFWVENLTPIINQIYKTSKGENNSLFWKSMYKWNSTSGGDRVTGWAAKFFPYLETKDGRKLVNRYLPIPYGQETRGETAFYYGLAGDDFPSGLSVCNFDWIYYGQNIDMQFCAGFVGITQDKDKVLTPEINWFIAEKSDSSKIKVKALNFEGGDYFDYLKAVAKEIDVIRPCVPELDTLFYDYCAQPDTFPIFNPAENKTFEAGWNDFLEYIKKPPFGTIEAGTVNVEFVINSEGRAFCINSEAKTEYLKNVGCSFVREFNEWKPAQKDGKIVLTKLKVEIEFKE
jgi:hypothetical protein